MVRNVTLSLALMAALASAQPTKLGGFVVEKELPRLPVLNQGQTGTCWCFATTSFLETEIQRLHGKTVDLSEMYTVRNTTIAKAKRFLDVGGEKGDGVFGEGGLSHDLIAMARDHGLLPADAYTGLVGQRKVHSHGEMFRVVRGMLDTMLKGRRQRLSEEAMASVAAVVDTYLGTPPATVEVDGKTMTPQEYARDHLQLPLDDYIEVMSYSYTPFHKDATLTVQDNWMKFDRYQNLPIEDFMKGFDHALSKGFSVAVDIDVSEKTYRPGEGIGTLSDELEKPGAITQEVRDQMFADKSTSDDHLMHVVGVTRDAEGKKFYLTKDSWGADHGKLNGYRMLSENYIRAKVLAYMVHKDGMPPTQ